MFEGEARLPAGVEPVAGRQEGLGVRKGIGMGKARRGAGHFEVRAEGGDPGGVAAPAKAAKAKAPAKAKAAPAEAAEAAPAEKPAAKKAAPKKAAAKKTDAE